MIVEGRTRNNRLVYPESSSLPPCFVDRIPKKNLFPVCQTPDILKYVILLVFAACAKSCKGEMD
jgi:hypothetical protein